MEEDPGAFTEKQSHSGDGNGDDDGGESIWHLIFLTSTSVVVALFAVLVFVAFGWYIVWKCFLSKFKFIRELLEKDTNSPVISKATRKNRKLKD